MVRYPTGTASTPLYNTAPGTYLVSYTPTSTTVTLEILHAQIYKCKVLTDSISHESQNVLSLVCNEDQYHFGFNGQMKTNECPGVGNHTTAKFWEYNTKEARRLNVEPKFKEMPSLSVYSTNNSNPIWYKDPLGDGP